MTIENDTPVRTPSGCAGRPRLTPRERELIAAGKKEYVQVLGSDGRRQTYALADLTVLGLNCRQCLSPVAWLAPDGHCSECTRPTP